MSATAFLVVIVGAWIVIGLVTSLVMARRGHEVYPWLMLGALMGPLVVLPALEARRRAATAEARLLGTGVPGPGAVDVLVGIDGSEASLAALRSARELLGPRIGRLTLAMVVAPDASTSPQGEQDLEAAGAQLQRSAALVDGISPSTVLLPGSPAETLPSHAREGGYRLLVIGSRGRGLSKKLLGSVASSLAADAPVPVLIASAGEEAPS